MDEDEDKENSATSTPKSVRPTEPPKVQRSRAFGTRIENVPDFDFKNLFQQILPCLCFNINYY